MRGKLAMRAGFALDRLVAFDRNRGVPAGHRLPGGRVVSRSTAIQRFPGLRRQGLTGAAVWYDYITTEADRLTFAWALAAAEHGAVLANHVEARARPKARRVSACGRDRCDRPARPRDRRAFHRECDGRVARPSPGADRRRHLPLLKAMNLVTRRDAGEEALGGARTLRPQSVSRPVARPRALRHLGIGSRRSRPTIVGVNGGGRRGVHRRAEPGVSGAGSVDGRRDARPPRRRTRRGHRSDGHVSLARPRADSRSPRPGDRRTAERRRDEIHHGSRRR